MVVDSPLWTRGALARPLALGHRRLYFTNDEMFEFVNIFVHRLSNILLFDISPCGSGLIIVAGLVR